MNYLSSEILASAMLYDSMYTGLFSGRSPKEYGQWLQSTGRQKWNKRKH